ncbi:MAG: dephospho-CoA kinase [Rhizobiales bacterium]|nr:dephospho-CoA kinase [Hyphomicrobiales bacterium]
MFILGLTGSIGMGKSTTAKMFAEAGVPVYDADAAVHRLYEGEATGAIEAAFPGTTANGKVDREKLAKSVLGDAAAIKRLESIVHPLVHGARQKFQALLSKQMLDAEKRRRADFIVDSSQGFDAARAQVRDILKSVAKMPKRQR